MISTRLVRRSTLEDSGITRLLLMTEDRCS
jgi:hypothetical protein